jgi:hypothetical protein
MRYTTLLALLCICGGCHGVLTPTPTLSTLAAVKPPKPVSITPSTYGAVGDGVADDTAALQRALNALARAGGTLRLAPYATYLVNTPLDLRNTTGFTIDGAGATLRSAPGAPTAANVGETLRLIGCRNGHVINVQFDGNRANRPPSAQDGPPTLRLQGCVKIDVVGNTFTNAVLDGLFLWCAKDPTDPTDACKNINIADNTFDNPGRNGISIIHGQACRVVNNNFSNANALPPAAGLDIEPNLGDAQGITHHILVDGNTFTNCALGAAAYHGKGGTHHVTYSNNRVQGCKDGLYTEAVGTVITGNTLENSALEVANTDMARVLGNVVVGSYLYVDTNGIAAPVGHTVMGNVVDVLYANQAGSGAVVANNVVTGQK